MCIRDSSYLDGKIYGEGGNKGLTYVRFMADSKSIPSFVGFRIEMRETANPTLDDVVQWQTEYISSQEKPHSPYDHDRILFKEVILSGEPAIRHMYKYRWSDIIQDEFYFIRQNEMIVIKMRVYQDYHEDYKNDFEQFAESFKSLE